MQEMVNGLMKKVGLSEDQAKQVVAYVKENAHKIPEWIGKNDMAKDLAGKLPGGMGDMFKK